MLTLTFGLHVHNLAARVLFIGIGGIGMSGIKPRYC